VSTVAVLVGRSKLPGVFCPRCGGCCLRVFFLVVSGGGHLKVLSADSYLKVRSFAKSCCDRTKLIFSTGSVGAVDSIEASVVRCL
jgi:hypothetical protein